MKIVDIKSSSDAQHWMLTAEFTHRPSWLSRLLLRAKDEVVTREFYSETGTLWHELPDMRRVSMDLEVLLESALRSEKARRAYSKNKEYMR